MGLSLLNFTLGLICAPFMLGIINKTKAKFAGRKGDPLLQIYSDLLKLLGKGAVYSRTTTWVLRVAPSIGLSCVMIALAVVPLHGHASLIHFYGDLFFFIYILGLMVFFTVLAALDTGSSFEGMGGSREVLFSLLAEPALIVGLCVFAKSTGSVSLSEIIPNTSITQPVLILVVLALFIVFLCENSRIPVDDPETHLELTMVHEVMVLDYSGPDFAFIMYGSAIKMWVLGMLIVEIILPLGDNGWFLSTLLSLLGMTTLAVVVGCVESIMARLRLVSVPKLLVAADSLSILAFILIRY
ncbi:MAG: NADH-quinone oxidoreductase subunit H [Deltaproteobacteria bacterium]|nr:NADH-quinone oxidoreductase subunit H [Deltaproteobacteria bacterium]